MEQQDLNFEVNLLPVISMLAVCISFLLLTAVWVQVGSLDLHQSFAEKGILEKEEPLIKISMVNNTSVQVTVEGLSGEGLSGKKNKFSRISLQNKPLESHFKAIRERYPDIKTAMVVPMKKSKYQNVILVFDILKRFEFKHIGLAPTK